MLATKSGVDIGSSRASVICRPSLVADIWRVRRLQVRPRRTQPAGMLPRGWPIVLALGVRCKPLHEGRTRAKGVGQIGHWCAFFARQCRHRAGGMAASLVQFRSGRLRDCAVGGATAQARGVAAGSAERHSNGAADADVRMRHRAWSAGRGQRASDPTFSQRSQRASRSGS